MNGKGNYRETPFQFIEEFPELRTLMRPEDRSLADDGPHPFFAFIAGRIVPELLADEARNAEVLERVFGFFERLAADSDEDIRGIVGLSVCEKIVGNEVVIEKYKRYAGPKTIALCADVLK
jgi:hypothetical protein